MCVCVCVLFSFIYLYRVLEKLPPGASGRWALGVVVLTHIIAYNEIGTSTAIFAECIAALCAIFSGKIGKIQIDV